MRSGSLFLLFLLVALAGLSAAQETNFSVGPQYLMTSGSPLFARPIATPSLSLGTAYTVPGAVTEASSDDSGVTSPAGLENQADLFPIYYGAPRVSVIEIRHTEIPRTLPVSIVNVGVVEATDVQSLRIRGFGVTLPEASSYWKIHKGHASRVYTNTDIERLQGS